MKASSLLLCFFCSTCLLAQTKNLPENPKPHHHLLPFEIAVLASSQTFDAISTRKLLNRGGWENNPAFGRHPSPKRQAVINLAEFSAESLLLYKTERSQRWYVRWAGRVYLLAATEEHLRLATCNSAINVQSPVAHNCRSFLPF